MVFWKRFEIINQPGKDIARAFFMYDYSVE
jgi:hypothetical protein